MTTAPPQADAGTVAGDFLGLLARHQVAPLRVDATLMPAQTQATTVFAFHCADGVLVAGDRRATSGNLVVTDRIDKVLELDDSSLLAIAGVPFVAFEMARTLQTSFEYYRRSQLQRLSLPAKVRALSRLLRDNLPLTLQGVGIVAPLFASLDHASEPPRPCIFFYDALGAQFQAVDFATSGSGSLVLRALFTYQERHGSPRPSAMSLDDAIRFALRCLGVASEFDTATGGVAPHAGRFATLRLLHAGGIRAIDDTQQAAVLGLGLGLGLPS